MAATVFLLACSVFELNVKTLGKCMFSIGQIAHSVLLGTFIVGERGEAAVPDIGRVIGVLLNSIGVGQPGSNGTGPVPFTSVQSNAPSQVSQVNGDNNAKNQGGTQAQTGEALSSQPVPSMPQVAQISPAAPAVPVSLAPLQTVNMFILLCTVFATAVLAEESVPHSTTLSTRKFNYYWTPWPTALLPIAGALLLSVIFLRLIYLVLPRFLYQRAQHVVSEIPLTEVARRIPPSEVAGADTLPSVTSRVDRAEEYTDGEQLQLLPR